MLRQEILTAIVAEITSEGIPFVDQPRTSELNLAIIVGIAEEALAAIVTDVAILAGSRALPFEAADAAAAFHRRAALRGFLTIVTLRGA